MTGGTDISPVFEKHPQQNQSAWSLDSHDVLENHKKVKFRLINRTKIGNAIRASVMSKSEESRFVLLICGCLI